MMEENKPYVAVCGGVNIDIGARSFAPLRARDSNPGMVETSLGGVGRNIAHNLSLLGVPVTLLTALGGDEHTAHIEASCRTLGIDLSHALRVPDGRTPTYVFVNDANGDMALAVSDMAVCERLTAAYLKKNLALLNGAALVVADTNLPRQALAFLAQRCTAPLFVDPVSVAKAEKLRPILCGIHTLKPNRLEAELLSGVAVTDGESAREAARKLLQNGVQRVFLSLGEEGVLCADANEMSVQRAYRAQMVNATGAGDAMMAALAWAYLRGETLRTAAALGAAAASIAVEGEKTINPALCAQGVLHRAGLCDAEMQHS